MAVRQQKGQLARYGPRPFADPCSRVNAQGRLGSSASDQERASVRRLRVFRQGQRWHPEKEGTSAPRGLGSRQLRTLNHWAWGLLWFDLCSPKRCLKSSTLVPVNMALFGNRIFVDINYS